MRVHTATRVTVAVLLMLGLTGTAMASKRPPADDPTKPPPPRVEVRPDPPPLPPRPETPPPPPPSAEPPPKPERPPAPEGPTAPRTTIKLEKEPTPGGLTKAEIDKLIEQGFDPNEIMEADAIAGAHGAKTVDLLSARKAGKTWGKIIAELPKRNQGTSPISVDDAFAKTIAETFGLTEGQVWALIARGYTPTDIGNAKRYADKYGMDMDRVLKRKGKGSWSDLAKKLGQETIPVEGLSKAEVAELADQGYSYADIRQAAEIAKVAKRPAAEILAMKGDREWLDVARELVPPRQKKEKESDGTVAPPAEKGGN